MKSLAKTKQENIKKKLYKFITNQKDTHMKLQTITVEHKYTIFEFYLEYFRNNYVQVKDNMHIQEMMFTMANSILTEDELPSKDMKNVIDFCTFVLKNSHDEQKFEKITQWANSMVFSSKNKDETIRNSISSFIKMIYFSPNSINDIW